MFLNIRWELFKNRSASVGIEIKGDFIDVFGNLLINFSLLVSLLLISFRFSFLLVSSFQYLYVLIIFSSVLKECILILYLKCSLLIFSILDAVIFPIIAYCYVSSCFLFSFFLVTSFFLVMFSWERRRLFVLILTLFFSSYFLHSLFVSAHLSCSHLCLFYSDYIVSHLILFIILSKKGA